MGKFSILLFCFVSACGHSGGGSSSSAASPSEPFLYEGAWAITDPLTNCEGPDNCVQSGTFPVGCNDVRSARPGEIIFSDNGQFAQWSKTSPIEPVTKTGDVYEFQYNGSNVIFQIEPFSVFDNKILIVFSPTCQFLMIKESM